MRTWLRAGWVLEVTEHAVFEEYGPVREAISRLRERGIRLAVDDAGAGYSG
ncbi:MAG: EAL domain-containing protein [Actinomycetota bacterium]